MSIQFDKPITEEHQEFIREVMGRQVEVLDDSLMLLKSGIIDQKKMKEIANETNQVVTVELNEPGEIKTMSDGTRYQVTSRGWRKIED